MGRKDKGPAPVGDSMHSPNVKRVVPDPQGNRAQRREAERQDKKRK